MKEGGLKERIAKSQPRFHCKRNTHVFIENGLENHDIEFRCFARCASALYKLGFILIIEKMAFSRSRDRFSPTNPYSIMVTTR